MGCLRAVGQAGLVRRRDVWLREGTAMGEANFLFAGNEHVQGPAEGLSSAGAPGQPALRRHSLTRAPRRPTCSRAPCTRHRAHSSSHPSCLLRAFSWEFLGSNHPSRCSLAVPAAPKPPAATGRWRWQQAAAAGPCRAPGRVGSQGRASLAPYAPLGRGAVLRQRSERTCGSQESQLSLVSSCIKRNPTCT